MLSSGSALYNGSYTCEHLRAYQHANSDQRLIRGDAVTAKDFILCATPDVQVRLPKMSLKVPVQPNHREQHFAGPLHPLDG